MDRAERSAKKRKRTLNALLEDWSYYDMGTGASKAPITEGEDWRCKSNLSEHSPHVENSESMTNFGLFGSNTSNTSLAEVNVDVDEVEEEDKKKQKVFHTPIKETKPETPALPRARGPSKRLDTPYVGTKRIFDPIGRMDKSFNTGVDVLKVHDDKRSGNKARESTEEGSLSRFARSMKMDNTDILRAGRNDIFKSDSNKFSNITPKEGEKPTPALAQVSQRKPGAHAILNQLGKQGIVPASAATDRSIDEFRQARAMSNPEDMPYVPSTHPPRRQMPRLTPIKNKGLTDDSNKPPWERDVLSDDRNVSYPTSFDFKPLRFSASKSRESEVMPLEVRLNTAGRLNVRPMQDLDDG